MLTNAELLVVDDTPESLRVLLGMLQLTGYRVRSANNGKRALASALKAPPDLILLDICMPDMTGYEVCRKLKQDESTRDIPVLFVSSLDETVDKLRAFEEGGLDYITKPYQEAEVLARIRTQLTILAQRRQIQADYQRLLRLEKMREGLTHMLVHDLRSPLTGVIGYAKILERGAASRLQPEELDYLTHIKELSWSLVEMVSTILDVSRLECDELPLVEEATSLGDLTREAVDAAGCGAVEVDGPLELSVYCDRSLIKRVLTNLTANALRYTPPGEKVEVRLSRKEGHVEARVCDRGPGIAVEHQQKIFEKFAQLDRSERHSGLGLTFCKLVMEKHCGQIGVDSAPGEGSQFWIRLPA